MYYFGSYKRPSYHSSFGKPRYLGRKTICKKTPLILLGFSIILSIFLYWILPLFFTLPMLTPKTEGLRVYDRNHQLLIYLPDKNTHYKSFPLTLNEIPTALKEATLAAEDARFYQHGGIDFLSLLRAGWNNIIGSHPFSGASTISAQVIKIYSPQRSRTLKTKCIEFFQARHLELTHNKDFILEAYLNGLDYGQCSRGAFAASQQIFQKPLDQLSLGECALLASIPQSPSQLNPKKNPQKALARRNWILSQMGKKFSEHYNTEVLTQAQNESLPLLAIQPPPTRPASYDASSRTNRILLSGTNFAYPKRLTPTLY